MARGLFVLLLPEDNEKPNALQQKEAGGQGSESELINHPPLAGWSKFLIAKQEEISGRGQKGEANNPSPKNLPPSGSDFSTSQGASTPFGVKPARGG